MAALTGVRTLGISLLRTFLVWVWGIAIGWVLLAAPIFEPFKDQLLALPDLALPTLVALISGALYAGVRWLEPRLPRWVVLAFLGSAQRPVYVAPDSTAAALDRVPGPDHLA